jgi:hypothetical protein
MPEDRRRQSAVMQDTTKTVLMVCLGPASIATSLARLLRNACDAESGAVTPAKRGARRETKKYRLQEHKTCDRRCDSCAPRRTR